METRQQKNPTSAGALMKTITAWAPCKVMELEWSYEQKSEVVRRACLRRQNDNVAINAIAFTTSDGVSHPVDPALAPGRNLTRCKTWR